MAGEFDFIDWVRKQQAKSELVQLPAGDDLAVLKWRADDLLLVGVDQVLDGVHFDSRIHSPFDIGRKVMNRNLSDCAAMACLPAAAVATVALPLAGFANQTTLDFAKELYRGLREAADPYDCALVGAATPQAGTASSPSRHHPRPFRRHRADHARGRSPKQRIYVTGPLGGSIIDRHMTFSPRFMRPAPSLQLGRSLR
jgi:thiamine-monophosphate kinase